MPIKAATQAILEIRGVFWGGGGDFNLYIQVVVDGTHLAEHCKVANVFANNFQLVQNNFSPGSSPSLSSSPDLYFYHLFPILIF
jgi:hypothetical protein